LEVNACRLQYNIGDYDDHLAAKAGAAATALAAPPVASPPPGRPPAKAPAAERRGARRSGLEREIKAIKGRLGAVEGQIHELEARLAAIGSALADPELYRDGQRARAAAQARKETEERVAWLMREWEELSQQLSTVGEDA